MRISNVLVIDADEVTQNVIANSVRALALGVIQSKDNKEAYAFLKSTHNIPALIILDLRSPRMHSWDFLTLLRSSAELRNIPVIVLTGDAVYEKNPKMGAYLSKPVQPEKLRALILALAPNLSVRTQMPGLGLSEGSDSVVREGSANS